ncbi:histidine kinase [Amylibacter cionae]|nr:histidine kinase [Amylibacter cionae]
MTHDFQDDIDEIARSTLVPNLLETVTLVTGMGFAAVARVTDSRWVTCRTVDKINFGLTPGDELDVETTLCHEVRMANAEIVIDDVQNDPQYCTHHTPEIYNIQSYISIPIYKLDGSFFGTLCAIDPAPRKLKDDQVLGMFRLFAKMIGDSLETAERLQESETAVEKERELAEIQQQFIAILAHDLRNPVNALEAGLRLLGRRQLDARSESIVSLMQASINRMGNLIENLLDHARERQDGGIIIERNADEPLEPVIQQIVSEIRAVSPEHMIECKIDLPQNVNCDRERIAQMLSNLLGNAVTHGAKGRTIQVNARSEDGQFKLSVRNEGDMIPPEHVGNLFLPFQQGNSSNKRSGLGLGLHIASGIAEAHGGRLSVRSDPDSTEFTFTMPQP